MTYLHLGHCRETRIFSPAGAILRTSKNLRGMLDYARVSPVAFIVTSRDSSNNTRGVLRVTYLIMIDFVRNRRSWRDAEHTMHNENAGYLTKPGIIGGDV